MNKRLYLLATIPIGLLAAPIGAAQPHGEGAPPPLGPTAMHGPPPVFGASGKQADGAGADVSDADIETFATIYVALRRTAERYEQRIAAAGSEKEAQKIQARLQNESQKTLERHGWTSEQYERVGEAVGARPELLEKALRLIERRS